MKRYPRDMTGDGQTQSPGHCAVVDRSGDTPDLEEPWFDTPYLVVPGEERVSAGLAEASTEEE